MADRLVEAQLRAPFYGVEPLARMLREAREERTRVAADVAASFTGRRPYRRTETPGKYLQHGRVVKPGEVVMLTQQQAKAFADMFEAATEVVHQ